MENQANSKKAEVIQAVKENPDLTYAQIAELFGVKAYEVAIWGNKNGIFRRRKLGNPEDDSGLDDRIRQLEQQLAEARRLKAATEIRFEREGSKVAVYGLGSQPIIAEHKDWLRFLRKEGAALLREFINNEFGDSNGNGAIH